MGMGTNLLRAQVEQKSRRRVNLFSLLELKRSPSPALDHKLFWFLWTQNWIDTVNFSGSQVSVFGLELHH